MWSREIIKSNAKSALRDTYWKSVLACFLVMVVVGGFRIITFRFNWNYNQMLLNPWYYAGQLASLRGQRSFLSLMRTLYGIFIGAPMMIGLCAYFVRNRFEVTDVSMIFSGFRRSYWNSVGAMFVTNLFIVLWSMLLVIPGIVKLVQYSMVPFILSDNPNLPGSRARQISRLMTDGQKGAIFVLWLSFFGWFLLGSLVVIGGLFVLPYFYATMAELYIYLRDRVLRSGKVLPAEFGMVYSSPYGGSEVY